MDSFEPARDDLATSDPLDFRGYVSGLERARATSGADESVCAGAATVAGRAAELVAFEFAFMGGSMGEVAGERVARAFERAARREVPVVLYTATGGARMQEGMRSLIQMPKLVAARRTLGEAGQPLVAVLGNPTTGGVLASAGALADVTIAEAGATIGFAGPRIVQRSTGRPLERGSHTAESALANGLVDAVVPRHAVRSLVGLVLEVLEPSERRAGDAVPPAAPGEALDPWDAVSRARAPGRLTGVASVEALCDAHVWLRGDRAGEDDPGLTAALGRVAGGPALVLALGREHAPGPAAFRKAMRCLGIAQRLGLPVVTLIDTRGADPSEGSEAGGIAWAVADTIDSMLDLRVPILAVVTGEGGSGGALALCVADSLVAFSDSIFTIIAPEAAAEILWRDPRRAPEASRALRLTTPELLRLGVADAMVQGPPTPAGLRVAVAYHLARLTAEGIRPEDRVARRRERWRDRG